MWQEGVGIRIREWGKIILSKHLSERYGGGEGVTGMNRSQVTRVLAEDLKNRQSLSFSASAIHFEKAWTCCVR